MKLFKYILVLHIFVIFIAFAGLFHWIKSGTIKTGIYHGSFHSLDFSGQPCLNVNIHCLLSQSICHSRARCCFADNVELLITWLPASPCFHSKYICCLYKINLYTSYNINQLQNWHSIEFILKKSRSLS